MTCNGWIDQVALRFARSDIVVLLKKELIFGASGDV